MHLFSILVWPSVGKGTSNQTVSFVLCDFDSKPTHQVRCECKYILGNRTITDRLTKPSLSFWSRPSPR